MILFHYTSAKHLAMIQKQGLHKGSIPWKFVNDQPTFIPGWQWLTENPDFDQEWEDPVLTGLPYRRNEYRITIGVPNFAYRQMHKWTDICAKYRPESAEFLNIFANNHHWRLFKGDIPASWFIAIDRNPTPIDLTHLHD